MVSDERALAVRLASTERRRPRPDVRGPRCRRRRPLARLLRRRRGTAGSGIRRARGRTAPPHVARRPVAALDGASLPASELAVLRPLALVGDDGAPFGAVAARVRTRIHRPSRRIRHRTARSARRRGERLRRRRRGRARLHDRRRAGRRAARGPAHAAVAHRHRCGQRDRSASAHGCRSPGRRRRTSTTWSPPPPPPTS